MGQVMEKGTFFLPYYRSAQPIRPVSFYIYEVKASRLDQKFVMESLINYLVRTFNNTFFWMGYMAASDQKHIYTVRELQPKHCQGKYRDYSYTLTLMDHRTLGFSTKEEQNVYAGLAKLAIFNALRRVKMPNGAPKYTIRNNSFADTPYIFDSRSRRNIVLHSQDVYIVNS